MRVQKTGAAIAILLLFLVSAAMAGDPVPLPDFQLTSLDGQVVKSGDLPAKGNWLIIYVQPRSQFSDGLLRLLKREQYPALEKHAIMIVGGSVDDMKTMRSRFDELNQAMWYADPARNAFTQLKLHGAPVVVGVKQQTITWSLNGVLPDTNVSKSILNTWISGS